METQNFKGLKIENQISKYREVKNRISTDQKSKFWAVEKNEIGSFVLTYQWHLYLFCGGRLPFWPPSSGFFSSFCSWSIGSSFFGTFCSAIADLAVPPVLLELLDDAAAAVTSFNSCSLSLMRLMAPSLASCWLTLCWLCRCRFTFFRQEYLQNHSWCTAWTWWFLVCVQLLVEFGPNWYSY